MLDIEKLEQRMDIEGSSLAEDMLTLLKEQEKRLDSIGPWATFAEENARLHQTVRWACNSSSTSQGASHGWVWSPSRQTVLDGIAKNPLFLVRSLLLDRSTLLVSSK